MKIYMAGPLFTLAEIEFNAKLALMLRARGHEVFLPQENEERGATIIGIFQRDVAGIDWSDVVLACMDGGDPDSGTCWECGYAFRKKPVIVYRTDFRAEEHHGPYNLMLTQSANHAIYRPFTSMDALESEIAELLAQL